MKCKKCKMDIPKGAKICPYCNSKQGIGCGTVILVAVCIVIIIFAISAVSNIIKGYNNASSETASSQPVISRSEYIAGCSEIAYDDLARNPDKYKGQSFVFTGEVIQVVEPNYGNTVYLRINVTKGKYTWSDTIFAEVELPKSADRILEDDIITIYGDCEGLYTYESITGTQVSVPSIKIRFFDISSAE